METIEHTKEALALAKAIECAPEEAQSFIDDGDWLVYTDEEADEAARDYILDSAWAFRYEFLCAHSDAISEIPKKEFEEMQGRLCEGFTKAVLAMLDDKEHFVHDAILSDGRGHFLSPYDGEEVDLEGGLYAYRCN